MRPVDPFTTAEQESIDKFEALCRREYAAVGNGDERLDHGEEQDWYSMSLGFFSALGHGPARAHDMAIYVRYTCKYWWP